MGDISWQPAPLPDSHRPNWQHWQAFTAIACSAGSPWTVSKAAGRLSALKPLSGLKGSLSNAAQWLQSPCVRRDGYSAVSADKQTVTIESIGGDGTTGTIPRPIRARVRYRAGPKCRNTQGIEHRNRTRKEQIWGLIWGLFLFKRNKT